MVAGPLLMPPGALEGVPGGLCSLEAKGGPFPQDTRRSGVLQGEREQA